MNIKKTATFLCGITAAFLISTFPALAQPVNLAAGKKVLFMPWPNYSKTTKMGNRPSVMTDGKLENPGELTADSAVVSWNFVGRVNVMVDLQKRCDISEVAMRFLRNNHYSDNAPVDMEIFVSDDSEHFVQVATRSPWTNPGLFDSDPIINSSDANIYTWRFPDLQNVRGRYVGFSFYAGGITATDELMVYGNESASTAPSAGTPSAFSMDEPQLYFHKPKLYIPSNISAPQPIGVFIPAKLKGDLQLELDLPQGISLQSPVKNTTSKVLLDGQSQVTITFKNLSGVNRILSRLYLKATKSDQLGNIKYRYRFADWQSADIEIPYTTFSVTATPAPKRLLTGFGWWYGSDNTEYPNALQSFQQLGLNSITIFSNQMPADSNDPQWQLLEKARAAGMKIIATDSPYNIMWVNNLKKPDAHEMYCQFADGTVGGNPKICPSYRGKYYQAELQRVAAQMARVRPDYIAMDTELWLPQGPPVEQCTRDQADFQKSGLKSWDEWLQRKGNEMEEDLINAIHQKQAETNTKSTFIAGMFGLKSTEVMERVFNFQKLYPQTIQVAQPAYYSPVNSLDLLNIAQLIRDNRAQMPHSDVIPWLTPGDADPIPAEAFQWSLLESYCNGARGVYFWSRNCWDGENLLAYSNAIRAITPAEDIVMDGQLINDEASVESPGHLSGMKKGNSMVLLISDYEKQSSGTLTLHLNISIPSKMIDLQNGKVIEQKLHAGKNTVEINLAGNRARLLEVQPDSLIQ
jgi:hypothetical protein